MLKNRPRNSQYIPDEYGLIVAFNHYGIHVSKKTENAPLPYDEMRDRWTLQPVARTKSNRLGKSSRLEAAPARPSRRPFWLRLFGQKA